MDAGYTDMLSLRKSKWVENLSCTLIIHASFSMYISIKSFKKSSSVFSPGESDDTHMPKNLLTTQSVLLQKLVHDTSTEPE